MIVEKNKHIQLYFESTFSNAQTNLIVISAIFNVRLINYSSYYIVYVIRFDFCCTNRFEIENNVWLNIQMSTLTVYTNCTLNTFWQVIDLLGRDVKNDQIIDELNFYNWFSNSEILMFMNSNYLIVMQLKEFIRQNYNSK